MSEVRCCLLCGRWGTRGYRAAWSSDGATGEGYVCTNDRACKRRHVIGKASFARPAKGLIVRGGRK